MFPSDETESAALSFAVPSLTLECQGLEKSDRVSMKLLVHAAICAEYGGTTEMIF